MSPPELTADAPVADVFHPVEVDALVAVGNEADFALLHHIYGGLGERLHVHEPLFGEKRLDHLFGAFRDGRLNRV